MDKVSGQLTVFFEAPFWVGVFERNEGGKLSVTRVVFGPEPKDYDVWAFILSHYYDLRFSLPVDAAVRETKKNPKRMQRAVKKQLSQSGIGTKSQKALKLQQEQSKMQRKRKSRDQKEAEDKRQYALRQQKKKEKHRGR